MIDMPLVLVAIMVTVHVILMLFFQLVTQVDVIINLTMEDRSCAIPNIGIEIEGEIDAVRPLGIQRDITEFVTAGREVLTVHEQFLRRRHLTDTR